MVHLPYGWLPSCASRRSGQGSNGPAVPRGAPSARQRPGRQLAVCGPVRATAGRMAVVSHACLAKIEASEEVQDVEKVQVVGPAVEATDVLGGDAVATAVVAEDGSDIPDVEIAGATVDASEVRV